MSSIMRRRNGEHTREVLRECGFDDREIDAFEKDGTITTAMPARQPVA